MMTGASYKVLHTTHSLHLMRYLGSLRGFLGLVGAGIGSLFGGTPLAMYEGHRQHDKEILFTRSMVHNARKKYPCYNVSVSGFF